MAHPIPDAARTALRALRWPLLATRAGLLAERALRAFWPLMSLVMLVLAALMLGAQDAVAVEIVWAVSGLAALATLAALIWGSRKFHWPTRTEALVRLDESLPGRPIRAVLDDQAIGANDAASRMVWRAHQDRMAERASRAHPVRPDLRLARRDPFALRFVALLALCMALLFGSFWRVGTMADMVPGGAALAGTGPTWEGWIEPPRYTGRPTLYLADLSDPDLSVPQGSRITLRFYGQIGALSLSETISGRTAQATPPATDPAQDFIVSQSGEMRIDGPGGQVWAIDMIADRAPYVAVTGKAEAAAGGEMTLPFEARDDYGVISGQAHIALDLAAVDRRYGLAVEPEPRDALDVDLPLPISGNRRDFTEKLIEDFSKHPWANLPVTITLSVRDAAGQVMLTSPFSTLLAGRHFFDPMAAAVIEQRRDLLWSRANAPRVAQVLRAVSNRPDEVFRSQTAYLRLRVILRRLEIMTEYGLKPAQQEEIATAMWDLAMLLEEGDLGDALERLRRAQEQLSQAMKNGASDQEIARLMQELRRASDDYIRQLSRQAQQRGDQQGDRQMSENTMQMNQEDLQKMMDRIQELMQQGRMAEAQEALRELQQLMENMRVTQSQGGKGQSEGQRAMEGLADTLRQQQGLSDQAFRDLQEQFNPGARAGESQSNRGRNGNQGQGQSHEGQGQRGQGQRGKGEGERGNQPGQGSAGQGQPGDNPGSLADRQQALRDELNRQKQQLPGMGSPDGQAAREALKRAGRAMQGAEESLRQDDYAGAIDQQSSAMEALREGMRALGEAMAQQRQGRPGQGNATGDMRARNRDPLGRNAGSQGAAGTDDNLLQGDDVYRRARELLDEIRRRSGEGARPQLERDYLRRLLDRF